MESEKIKEAVRRISAAVAELKKVKGWNWSGLQGLIACVPVAVGEVEKAKSAMGLDGADAKEVVIRVVCELVPDSWFPDSAVRWILSWAIERAVARLRPRPA